MKSVANYIKTVYKREKMNNNYKNTPIFSIFKVETGA